MGKSRHGKGQQNRQNQRNAEVFHFHLKKKSGRANSDQIKGAREKANLFDGKQSQKGHRNQGKHPKDRLGSPFIFGKDLGQGGKFQSIQLRHHTVPKPRDPLQSKIHGRALSRRKPNGQNGNQPHSNGNAAFFEERKRGKENRKQGDGGDQIRGIPQNAKSIGYHKIDAEGSEKDQQVAPQKGGLQGKQRIIRMLRHHDLGNEGFRFGLLFSLGGYFARGFPLRILFHLSSPFRLGTVTRMPAAVSFRQSSESCAS